MRVLETSSGGQPAFISVIGEVSDGLSIRGQASSLQLSEAIVDKVKVQLLRHETRCK
jgi:hypothetical protein